MLRWSHYQNCVDLAAAQHTFENLAVEQHFTLDLPGDSGGQRIQVHFVSVALSKVSGLPMTLGRWFATEEDVQHGPLVAVLSDRFWKSQYESDPNIIGKTITASGFYLSGHRSYPDPSQPWRWYGSGSCGRLPANECGYNGF
jgi:MacB-like periplasmic core domain